MGSVQGCCPGAEPGVTRRQHVEHRGGEDRHQQDADHELGERRQRQAPDRDGAVELAVSSQCGDGAQEERDGHAHQRGDEHQDERVEHACWPMQPRDRSPLCERVAEVAGDDAAEPAQVLLRHGLVEPELLLERLVAVDVRRLPAEDRLGGVAGQGLRRDEDDDRHQEQRQHAQADPDEDQLQERGHGSRLPLLVLLIMLAASRGDYREAGVTRAREAELAVQRAEPAALVRGESPRARGAMPRARGCCRLRDQPFTK